MCAISAPHLRLFVTWPGDHRYAHEGGCLCGTGMMVAEWLAGLPTRKALVGAYKKSTGYLILTYLARATLNAEQTSAA